jgi:transcriptional regulator with XRE-family HTH domain
MARGRDNVLIPKGDFGARVKLVMESKGWNQSELARRAGLNRDAVSTYIRGAVYPTELSLQALARALDVDPEELLPSVEQAGRAKGALPSIHITVPSHRQNEAWLKVDRRVSLKTALAVAQLLDDDKLLT